MPRWRDVKELFYVTNAVFTAVDVVSDGTALQLGTLKPLFRSASAIRIMMTRSPYAVRKDSPGLSDPAAGVDGRQRSHPIADRRRAQLGARIKK